MQVQIVKNSYYNNSNSNFTAELVDTYALRKFKAGLTPIEFDKFGKYIADIESINDGKFFEYKSLFVGKQKIDKIHEIDNNGKAINPPMFLNCGEGNSLGVFKQMADWYKQYADRF